MVKINKKKAIVLINFPVSFFKTHLAQIVFLVFAIQLLVVLNAFPYFNIINKYYFYATVFVWVLIIILFRIYITNKMMLVAGIAAFIISAPFTILGIETVSDIMGFLAFLLIFTYILREIFSYRNQLKNK